MGCGCKKKNTESTTQPAQEPTQTSTQTTDQTTQTQDQVIKVAVQLREMIEKKEL